MCKVPCLHWHGRHATSPCAKCIWKHCLRHKSQRCWKVVWLQFYETVWFCLKNNSRSSLTCMRMRLKPQKCILLLMDFADQHHCALYSHQLISWICAYACMLIAQETKLPLMLITWKILSGRLCTSTAQKIWGSRRNTSVFADIFYFSLKKWDPQGPMFVVGVMWFVFLIKLYLQKEKGKLRGIIHCKNCCISPYICPLLL